MQDLSCVRYCAFAHFGNTGENIKRIQDTREYPKISVIEIIKPRMIRCVSQGTNRGIYDL